MKILTELQTGAAAQEAHVKNISEDIKEMKEENTRGIDRIESIVQTHVENTRENFRDLYEKNAISLAEGKAANSRIDTHEAEHKTMNKAIKRIITIATLGGGGGLVAFWKAVAGDDDEDE